MVPQAPAIVNRNEAMRTETTNPGYWAVIPAAVRYAAGLPPGAKLLYAEISSLTDQRGYCFAKNAYFAELYGVSEPTIQRYLRALKAGGYVRIEDGAGGKEERKIYAGVNPLAAPHVKNDTPVKIEGGGVSKMTPPINELNKKEEQSPPKPPRGRRGAKKAPEHEPELFERFWKAYPRGEDKQGAMREWDALRPDADLMRVMAGALQRQKATEEWQRGVGIPYACRWLKYRRWEDELRAPAASAPVPQARTVEIPEEVPRW